MAEVRTGEFSKYRSNLIDMHADMKVWLWDCGPEKPKPPVRPDPPSGKQGDPEYDLAVIEFKESLENYEAALKLYATQKKEFAFWDRQNGGPIEMLQWSVDARQTLAADARAVADGRQSRPRWHISSRTRGSEGLKNHGLPIGMKPGHGHQANIERQLAGEKEFAAALRSDPVFGQEQRQ